LAEAKELVEITGYPYFVTSMGKGSVSEHLPTFGGTYGGIASFPGPKKAIESSDCVLWLGNYPVSKLFPLLGRLDLLTIQRVISTRMAR
jgi:pyruvate decarboxylase